MAKKALITGINGFVGAHLTELLMARGFKVTGLDVSAESSGGATPHERVLPKEIKILPVDLRDGQAVSDAIAETMPDVIFHLAAQSSVKLSFENPVETFSININGSLNILEAIANLEKAPKMLLISSSEIYGQLKPEEVPVTEQAPLAPVNPYAVSKAAVDLMAYQYFKAYDLPVYWARAFSHAGPGQRTVAVLSDWSFQTARIELGLSTPEIKVGNLEVTRDYTDVRDTVRAYLAILEKGLPGQPYNVCSGNGYKLADLLQIIASFSSRKIEIVEDQSRLRPVDIPILIGSPARLRADTGWEQRISIDKTLHDIYDYWIGYLTPQMK